MNSNAGLQNIESILACMGNAEFAGWQIAEKGDWKNTHKISVSFSLDEKTVALDWVRRVGQDTAIEALFALESGEKAFFGMRLEKESKETQVQFIDAFLTNIRQGSNFKTVVCKMGDIMGVSLANSPPPILEVGVFNLWKDVGSQIVFKRNETPGFTDFSGITANLQKDQPFPVMLEAAWKEPYPHWIGIPVSEKLDTGLHRLDRLRYATVAQAALMC